jgi:hypothetical protein
VRQSLLSRAVAVLAILAGAGAARAQTTDVVVTVTPAVAPLRDGVTHLATSSTLSLGVANRRSGLALRHITFQLPAGYAVLATTQAPSGWRVSSLSGGSVEFRTIDCTQPGIPASVGTGTFLVNVTTPNDGPRTDVTGEALSVTNLGDDYCTGIKTWTVTTPTFTRRVLEVTGAAAPATAFAGPASVNVTWTITNHGKGRKNPVVLENRAIAGLTATCTPASLNLNSGNSGTITCTYLNVPAGTYAFAASANAGATATAIGSTIPFRVGAPRVTSPRPYLVRGRAPYSLSITVVNDSDVGLSQFTVTRPDASWTGISSTTTGASCNVTTGACSFGALAQNASATVNVSFSAIPSPIAPTSYNFSVHLTPTTGTAVDLLQTVTVVVPLPDVARLTLQSSATGQTLAWTNADGTGNPHDGVVVFRTPAGTEPPLPTDFVDYTILPRPAEVLYADSGRSTANTLADPIMGRYWYRVCNRDAYLVYSGCRTGFWNNKGYADSAVAPAGGWTHQLGGFAALIPGIVPGNRVGVATNRLEVDVLDLATGHRSFDPSPLPALPSSSTPATRVADGRLLLFAADSSGTVTAVNLDTGAQAWQRTLSGESFVAGVSGITRSYGAPEFQAAYPMDVLLLASTSGRVIALDATNGNPLWTLNAGSSLRAALVYDPGVNRFYVPTSTAGVLAYDMTGSSPTVAPGAAKEWQNPGGSYRLYCIRTFQADSIGCLDNTGQLRVLGRIYGEVRAQLTTGISTPTTLTRVVGTSPGFVIGNASAVQRVLASGTPLALTSAGTYTAPANVTISSAITFSSDGFMVVAGSDLLLHKLSLANAQEIGQSAPLTSATSGASLGPIGYDSTDRLFVFGTSEGRVWAIPRF